MLPEVTIIIPTHNMGYTLEKAINSILSQQYPSFEVIVMDDGSTDNTKSLVETHFNNSYLRYLFQKRGGRASALNKAITESKGRYVSFLDADDTLTEDSLEKRVSYLKTHPEKDAVFADTNFVDKKGKIYDVRRPTCLDHQDLILEFLAGPRGPFHPLSLMYRRVVFNKVSFNPPMKRREDTDFVIRLLQECSVGYLPHTIYNHTVGTHGCFNRLGNRLISLSNLFTIIQNYETTPSQKFNLYSKAFLFETLKFFYEIFWYKK